MTGGGVDEGSAGLTLSAVFYVPGGPGMVAAWWLSSCEEIPHIQGQRSPSKTVGTGAAAVQHWGDFEKILNVKGKGEGPARW